MSQAGAGDGCGEQKRSSDREKETGEDWLLHFVDISATNKCSSFVATNIGTS